MNFEAINPATGDLISTHEPHTAAHAMDAVGRAHAAHMEWRSKSVQDRTTPLLVLAGMLRARADEFGRLMTLEMGKPLSQGIAEAEKCATVCEYYAENGPAALSPVTAHTDASKSYWTHQPLGVVLGIMPWNFPFWQVVRFAAPTLTAGNAVLLKHAPSVPGCALALEELFSAAGYPDGLFANVFPDIQTTGPVIADRRIRAVSLTGSVRAGQSVASRAGAAIKKCVLELGGSDPSVVLADADLELTVASCALGRLINTGQSCVAAKRFVVVESIREDFEKRLVATMSKTVMGDPLRDDTDIGPMARLDLRDALHDQVLRSVASGARLVLGGTVPDQPGAWYPPTILADVRPGMAAYSEELFGPVASIVPAADEADAVRIANDTSFGLGASIYTTDVARGEQIAAEQLDAGNCFVNGIVKSDPGLPFGGTKQSGYGRELSPLGILEFTNTKTVWVK